MLSQARPQIVGHRRIVTAGHPHKLHRHRLALIGGGFLFDHLGDLVIRIAPTPVECAGMVRDAVRTLVLVARQQSQPILEMFAKPVALVAHDGVVETEQMLGDPRGVQVQLDGVRKKAHSLEVVQHVGTHVNGHVLQILADRGIRDERLGLAFFFNFVDWSGRGFFVDNAHINYFSL